MSKVTYYPERDQWTLSDDQHWLEVPEWARGIILAQHERENRRLRNENDRLRELVRLLLWGVDNDMPRYEELAWTQKVNALVRELGVEESE